MVLEITMEGEEWVSNHIVIEDLCEYTQRIETLVTMWNNFTARKRNFDEIHPKFQEFVKLIEKSLEKIKV